jgi:hypothetical protein
MSSMPLALLFALVVAGTAAGATRYEVTASADARLDVRVCVDEAAASRRFTLDADAADNLDDLARDTGGTLERGRRGVIATGWRAGECLTYAVSLAQIAQRRARDVGLMAGEDIVVAPTQWLVGTGTDVPADLTLRLPDGYAFSAPWTRLPDAGGARRYRIPATPDDWAGMVAFGRFPEREVRATGGVLRIAALGGMTASQADAMAQWIGDVARAAVTAYGRLPLEQIQVMLIASKARGGAVGFGQSTRGQGQALTIFVDPTRPLAEIRADWTAIHELSHVAHPYLGEGGAWLAEGLASYWQNVLRARAGQLTPEKAWELLDAGFGRGRAAANADMTLHDVTRQMHERRAYMRVYWAGAAYWLGVDVELRRASGGRLGVDVALSRFRDCCLGRMGAWQPEDFVMKLDALVGTDVFVRRWREADAQRGFPDLAPLYSALGIVHKKEGAPGFDPDAPDAAIRAAIMRPRD